MRYLANQLHNKGFTVSVPLLEGHGTTKDNLAKTGWKDWYESCHKVYLDLQEKYSHVFVTGLSLGGIIALKLAEDYPQGIQAISCLATPIHLKSWVNMAIPIIIKTPLKFIYPYQQKADADVKDPNARKNYWNIDQMPLSCVDSLMKLQKKVRQSLSKVLCPTLIIHSRYDSTAPYESMNYISKNISSKITETITLENSFHLITIDYDKELVANKVGEFFMRFMK